MAVVLDIEGTVCPISFVHDVLFPYALRKARLEIPRLSFPLDPARTELEAYLAKFPPEFTQSASALLGHIEYLIEHDVKAGYLKSLQGFLWREGYESGEIKAPLYADAVEAMKDWAKHTKIYIYSSGSVPAQKLLFAHTEYGDLTELISGYYDTTNAGSKLESESYSKIASETGHSRDLRFYSDNPKEIDAASAAGWATTFVVRPGNPAFPDYKWPDQHTTSFTK